MRRAKEKETHSIGTTLERLTGEYRKGGRALLHFINAELPGADHSATMPQLLCLKSHELCLEQVSTVRGSGCVNDQHAVILTFLTPMAYPSATADGTDLFQARVALATTNKATQRQVHFKRVF